MTLSEISVNWRGLTFGSGSAWRLLDIAGWQTLPATSKEQQASPWGRGLLASPIVTLGRTVLMTGSVLPVETRDTYVDEWHSEMYLAMDEWATEPLTVSMAGRSLTVSAQLAEASIEPREGWMLGRLAWSARWECDDPLRYDGITDVTVEGPPFTAGAGLALPASLPNTFPANPAGGAVAVTNTGNAPAPCKILLSGPWASPGVAVQSASGTKVVLYNDLSLGASDSMLIETREGAGFLNGSYRPTTAGSDMVSSLELPPGVNSIVGQGTPGSGARVTVWFRPAYW